MTTFFSPFPTGIIDWTLNEDAVKNRARNTISCEFIFFSAHSEMKCSRTIAAIQRCLYTKLRNVSFQQLSQQSSKYTFISSSARGRIRCSRTIVATQKDVCTQNHAMPRFNRRFKLPQQNTLQQHPSSNVKNNKSAVPRQFLTKMFMIQQTPVLQWS